MSTIQSQEFDHSLRDIFISKKHQTKSGNWITVKYCTICGHRVGSKKIHDNLHKLADAGLDLDSSHNGIIGKYWEKVDSLTHITFNWTDLEDKGSVVHGMLRIKWDELTAMTAIDREIRNLLRPSETDKNADKEAETRTYYSAPEAQS